MQPLHHPSLPRRRLELDRYIYWGLAVSFAAHVILGVALTKHPPRTFDTPLFVEIIPAPSTPQQRQLVDPAESPERPPAQDTRLESERDSATDREQIRRGDPLAGTAAGKQSASPPSPKINSRREEPRSDTKTASNSLRAARPAALPQPAAPLAPTDLMLDPDTMLRSFGAAAKKERSNENPLLDNATAAVAAYAP
ncbi:MAG: hypothetical protein EBZ48_17115, partial [Proteobacteria bacterium]|nr:hypothetical protein [Pseudomonadota bacterium]